MSETERETLTTAQLAEKGQPEADEEESRAEPSSSMTGDLEPLLSATDAEGFRGRWESVQAGFVDEPRQSVEQADGLVAELMQKLAQTFTDERSSLEAQWSRGDDVSTEDLRVALQRYRSFFERLLAA